MAAINVWPKGDGDVGFPSDFNSQTGAIVTVEAGEAITAGNVVYIHLTLGTAFVSDLVTQGDRRAVGIALNTAALAADVNIRVSGVYTSAGAFIDREDYYIGNAGALSTTVSPVRVGTALSANDLWVHISQDDRDAVGTIKSWLQNHAGMPASMLNAFWKLCDGSLISDTESPLNNAGAGEAPDLNTSLRMLIGAATSDIGTDNTAAGGTTHGNHGPGMNDGGGAAKTEGFNNVNHMPPRISVVFIMKIK